MKTNMADFWLFQRNFVIIFEDKFWRILNSEEKTYETKSVCIYHISYEPLSHGQNPTYVS